MSRGLNLCAGEIVEIRSRREILRTLDGDGRLEGLPFMPEMFRYCGRRVRVYKRAHKTCDFVTLSGSRRLRRVVHLEDLRCDGSAHGGCQAECALFWKEEWLKPVELLRPGEADRVPELGGEPGAAGGSGSSCREEDVWNGTRAVGQKDADADPVFVCQATLLPQFTQPLAGWDIRQYIEDYRSGNVASIWRMIPRCVYRCYDNLVNLGIGWGPVLRWAYDRCQSVWGGLPYPGRTGNIRPGMETPSECQNVQPGDLVRVRDYKAILETIDGNSRNRGLAFSAEMVPYCGGVFRVHSRVERIIDERTGRMIRMKNPCVILDGVVCRGRFNKRMIFCPRATYPYWREIWLERVIEKS